jgi:hypothetical protein
LRQDEHFGSFHYIRDGSLGDKLCGWIEPRKTWRISISLISKLLSWQPSGFGLRKRSENKSCSEPVRVEQSCEFQISEMSIDSKFDHFPRETPASPGDLASSSW